MPRLNLNHVTPLAGSYALLYLFAERHTPVKKGPEYAGVAQLVEHELPKLGVAGSNPVARSRYEAGPRYEVGFWPSAGAGYDRGRPDRKKRA